MARRPAKAGTFYPAEAKELARTLDDLWPSSDLPPHLARAI